VLDYNGMAHSGNFHLNANDVLEFQVKVTVPAGTPENHWNGTLLTASSDKCFDYSTSIKLFTFIPIPE